jgi:hypothetical protein
MSSGKTLRGGMDEGTKNRGGSRGETDGFFRRTKIDPVFYGQKFVPVFSTYQHHRSVTY